MSIFRKSVISMSIIGYILVLSLDKFHRQRISTRYENMANNGKYSIVRKCGNPLSHLFWMMFPRVKIPSQKVNFSPFKILIYAGSKNILCSNKCYSFYFCRSKNCWEWCMSILVKMQMGKWVITRRWVSKFFYSAETALILIICSCFDNELNLTWTNIWNK